MANIIIDYVAEEKLSAEEIKSGKEAIVFATQILVSEDWENIFPLITWKDHPSLLEKDLFQPEDFEAYLIDTLYTGVMYELAEEDEDSEDEYEEEYEEDFDEEEFSRIKERFTIKDISIDFEGSEDDFFDMMDLLFILKDLRGEVDMSTLSYLKSYMDQMLIYYVSGLANETEEEEYVETIQNMVLNAFFQNKDALDQKVAAYIMSHFLTPLMDLRADLLLNDLDMLERFQTARRELGQLNWGVLGTGVIANEMAVALKTMGKEIYSVANRTYEKGLAFAKKYGIRNLYDHMDEIFEDPMVDIIYLTTPHNTHYQFMKKAIEHGKHLLVEKSITLNSEELEEVLAMAAEKNLIVAEAMTIWHMPLYKSLWKIVRSGALGKVQMITMNFGSFKEYNMENRFFNRNLAGGAMLDIGVYALSIVRSFMSSMPDEIVSQWLPAPTGVDEQATILLKNKEGQMATVALSMHSKQPKRAMISCEKGYIEIMEYPRACKAIIVDAKTGVTTEVADGDTQRALEYEMRDMEAAILEGKVDEMQLTFSRDVMKIMTQLRREWGMTYPEEE